MKHQLLFSNFPSLKSDRILIHQIDSSDAEALFDITKNDSLYEMRSDSPKKTLRAVNKLIATFQQQFESKQEIGLGIYWKENHELVGYTEIFDVHPIDDRVTIGYLVNSNHWKQGIAQEAVSLLLEYLFNQIDVHRIQAFIHPQNVRSQKVVIKNGFCNEGLLRQYEYWIGKGFVDLNLFSILKSEFRNIKKSEDINVT